MYRWHSICTFFVLFICMLSLMACGGKLSNKQQSVMWMSLYNQNYKDAAGAMVMTVASPQSEEHKKFLVKKLEILVELKPLLDTYDTIVWSDGTPDDRLMSNINYLVYRLTDLIVEGSIK